VARKELVTSFRDRQTAIYTVVLPICLYPVMFWIMIQGLLLVQGRREHTPVEVGLATAAGVEVPADLGAALTGAGSEPDSPTLEALELRELGQATALEPLFEEARAEPDAPLDAVLFLDNVGEPPALIAYDSTDPRSNLARSRVETRLEGFADAEREAAAQAAGVDPAALQPLVKVTHNLAPDEEMGAFVISLLFPLLLVVMTLMGAFHPAVDMTAGERERGTAETTLLLPVPRRAVHQGKILAVCATAVLATSLNLLALGLSAGHLLEMLGAGVSIEVELPVAAFLRIAPLALLFAFFTSASLTGIAALAKSFKEGQALLGPVQMLFLVPAMSGVMPGLELDPGLAFVPVVNVVIAFRSLLRGEVLPLEYALTALSMLLYAGLAIAFAVRVLSRETIATSGETVPLSRLFTFLRSERATR